MLRKQGWAVSTATGLALAGWVCLAGMAMAAESLRLDASHQRLATKNNPDGTATMILAITLTNTGSVAAQDLRLVLLKGPGLPVRPGKNVLAVGGLAAGQRVKLTWPVSVLAPTAARVPLIFIHAEGIEAGGTMPVSTGVLSRADNAARPKVSTAGAATPSLVGGVASARGRTERVSVDSDGNQGNDDSFAGVAISATGRFVTFGSLAGNLVPGDTNRFDDIFVHDRKTGTTERVSVDSAGNQGNAASFGPAISANGRFVAFFSFADNLVADDTNRAEDIFVHDRESGMTELVSVDSVGNQGNNHSATTDISADGRFVAFVSYASNLVPGDSNGTFDVFVHDRKTGVTDRVSVDSAGNQANDESLTAAISAYGRFVAFDSYADNLVPGDTNGDSDVFVHDRKTGATERVSVDSDGKQANNYSAAPAISANGRFVAFYSDADNLVPGDTNGHYDIFVHDRETGKTERISVDSAGNQGNADSSAGVAISATGRLLAFSSLADNLAPSDTNRRGDVFVHDRKTGVTERVSVDSAGTQGNDETYDPAISANGRFVAFSSLADNLVPGDTNRQADVFVHRRAAE